MCVSKIASPPYTKPRMDTSPRHPFKETPSHTHSHSVRVETLKVTFSMHAEVFLGEMTHIWNLLSNAPEKKAE